ncbi:MAG TPA: hypothetical protein VHE60_13470 [Pyrinomonadaceae bacterium]|nr:hypothetical protein [Pyrinomonadaceae bacterium]
MRRSFIVLATILLVQLLAVAGLAQQDRLQGRWEGTAKSFQGERPATVIFKKEADGYTGTITGLLGPITFKEVKVDGDSVTANAEVDSPQAGRVTINYKFVLQGETLKGEGAVEVDGQTYNFTYDLKRVSAAAATQEQRPSTRPLVPQPQQKQSLDYFVGQWAFTWVGRESALGPGGRREGMTTFKLAPGGKTLESHTDGKSEEGSYQESAVIGFDETTKMLSFAERRRDLQVASKGDWTSPISIRFTVDPIKVKGQTLQLRRTIEIISAYSFTVTEELSEDGGPFVRLGQAIFSKANLATPKN